MALSSTNRLLVALAIIILIAGAMFTSFGRNLFSLNTPSVVLPNITNGGASSGASSHDPQNDLQQIRVTPDTVQAVIGSLQRNDSYYRDVVVTLFWEGGSATSTTSVWKNQDWLSTQRTLPTGAVRHELVGPDEIFYWYGSDKNFLTAPADEFSADLAQHIPTYETILALDTDNITTARYETKEGIPSIYVESVPDDDLPLERYWIGTQTGLLIGAEMEEDGAIIYRMTAYTPIQTPAPVDAPFTRPDGVLVYSLSPSAQTPVAVPE